MHRNHSFSLFGTRSLIKYLNCDPLINAQLSMASADNSSYIDVSKISGQTLRSPFALQSTSQQLSLAFQQQPTIFPAVLLPLLLL